MTEIEKERDDTVLVVQPAGELQRICFGCRKPLEESAGTVHECGYAAVIWPARPGWSEGDQAW